jgi:hypothetical protein
MRRTFSIAFNGFGISEVAGGRRAGGRKAISRIPSYALSRAERAASITGIISEAVMAQGKRAKRAIAP